MWFNSSTTNNHFSSGSFCKTPVLKVDHVDQDVGRGKALNIPKIVTTPEHLASTLIVPKPIKLRYKSDY